MWNEHLGRFGCLEVPRRDYLSRLAAALNVTASWEPFQG
jgi:Leu/Phe-tRNA-protein transferase